MGLSFWFLEGLLRASFTLWAYVAENLATPGRPMLPLCGGVCLQRVLVSLWPFSPRCPWLERGSIQEALDLALRRGARSRPLWGLGFVNKVPSGVGAFGISQPQLLGREASVLQGKTEDLGE